MSDKIVRFFNLLKTNIGNKNSTIFIKTFTKNKFYEFTFKTLMVYNLIKYYKKYDDEKKGYMVYLNKKNIHKISLQLLYKPRAIKTIKLNTLEKEFRLNRSSIYLIYSNKNVICSNIALKKKLGGILLYKINFKSNFWIPKYLTVHIPTIYNVVILNNNSNDNIKYVYITGKNYYYFFLISDAFEYDYVTQTFIFNFTPKTTTKWVMDWFLKNFMKSIERYFFDKMSYKGKSFKISKAKKKFYNFDFGHSHYTYVRFKKIKFHQRKKYEYFIRRVGYYTFWNLLGDVTFLRRWNMYTQRGLRIKKQWIFKKTGKVSTYV